ncbi:MAG: YkgJ family cysteine cluster protein [Bdellovibrionales bacterium]|nr:YkgJ family cysteine cluster protein [Bdellovibrionales bacterium]
MSLSGQYSQFLTIVDNYIGEAVEKTTARGRPISCGRGCSACCYMMVETSWDEAVELAAFIRKRPKQIRDELIRRVKAAARERRKFFSLRRSTERYCRPTASGKEATNKVTEDYFYDRKRPCPLLDQEKGICSVYPARPTACRLHIVSSPAQQCAREAGRGSSFTIPREIESARKRVERKAERALTDPRWGELSIMLDHILSHDIRPEIDRAQQ